MTITTLELRGGRDAIQRLIQNTDWSEIQCVICFATHAGWWRSFQKDMRRKSALKGLLCLNWLFYSSIRRWTASCRVKNKQAAQSVMDHLCFFFKFCWFWVNYLLFVFFLWLRHLSSPSHHPCPRLACVLVLIFHHPEHFPPPCIHISSPCLFLPTLLMTAKTTRSLRWTLKVKQWIPQTRLWMVKTMTLCGCSYLVRFVHWFHPIAFRSAQSTAGHPAGDHKLHRLQRAMEDAPATREHHHWIQGGPFSFLFSFIFYQDEPNTKNIQHLDHLVEFLKKYRKYTCCIYVACNDHIWSIWGQSWKKECEHTVTHASQELYLLGHRKVFNLTRGFVFY